MQGNYKLFGQRLVERNIISQKQLDEAIHRQQTSMSHRKIGEILVRLGYISKSHITEALSDQLGIPVVKISDREIPERIRGLVDGGVATLYRAIPIEDKGRTIVLATSDPTNINNLDNLSRLLDKQVEPVLATPEEIAIALNKYYGLQEQTVENMLSTVSSASTMSSLSSMSNLSSLDSNMSSLGSLSASDISMSSLSMDGLDVDESALSSAQGMDIDEADANNPVVQYVHQMIMEAFRLRASDIHVEPGKYDVKVRYRVDGVLQLMPNPPKRAQAAIISRLKIMAGMDIAERRVPQDGRIKMMLGGKMVDLRVSALPSFWGESVVMRILDKSGLMLGLGQLGFSPEDQRTWEELLNHATGVILVTGPTGSGKTTTLYASLHTLNQPDTKLITVEDPVEYQLAGINQVQIQHDIGWNFARALRAIFRQDPDIVMVGEIRDLETAEIAIKAALTGHLVFSTLHTNDTASSYIRLIDIGIKPFLVASGIRAILAQRLVRTICTTCKEPYIPPEVEVERLAFKVDLEGIELYHGAGCDNCNGTGYQGRLGVYELMITTDELRTMIMKGESAAVIRRAARLGGMGTMRNDAWRKCLNGITTIEEVNRRTRVDEPLRRAVETAAA
ncbi:MAG: Flp pilus assembly complex ATPase component TadA, partial [Candidatus Hydrogenedentes bacterium]|nr:Flp pilus assembly complex ATPase component TadA [Candidatus Hydrogenedentota bacterium]